MDPLCVLCVDDLSEIRLLTHILLHRFRPDWQLLEAQNGQEAIAVAHTTHPDVILMNIHMPIMNGYDATIELKESDETTDIPIIIYSAATYLRHEILQAGASAFLVKPSTPDALIQTIESVIGIHN